MVARRTAERMWSARCSPPRATSVAPIAARARAPRWAGFAGGALHEEALERGAGRDVGAAGAIPSVSARARRRRAVRVVVRSSEERAVTSARRARSRA
ncbi:hypothetical protein SCE1572_38890 [Sorangium cellulosum So0157-2]|uniref:Uncharacterized protein n=1 Tax=Sorangium cellulosum So0157-2 TaxID=1254432 RepID=S4Y6X8_SORCE|nr:hypothetical protein SCE1572_38890 [Sorangium cellulosum So0157-2]